MKTSSLYKSATLVSLLGVAVSAHAAGITIGTGDIILGFQDSTNSIQFDMGNVSALNALNGVTTDLGFNVNTALSYSGTGTTGYGSGWASSSVVWDVAGKDAANFYTGMAQTAPLSTLGSGPAVANSTLAVFGDTTTAQSSISPMMAAMANEPTSVQLKAGGSTVLAAKYLNSNTASMNKINPNTAAGAFGTIQNSTLLNTAVTATATGTAGLLAGKTYSALDLYQFTGAAGHVTNQFLGTLELSNTGEVYFTSAMAAIPEPTTYAAILGLATLGFAALRRRKQAVVA